jgi:aspartate 1-decarboxylase
MRTFLSGKIHRATVTGADLEYEGSITLDLDLMEAASMMVYEKVQVLDVTNGARLETYVIPGVRGSGEVCINGAAAHLVYQGDIVIILAYLTLTEEEMNTHTPRLVQVDAGNKIVKISSPSLMEVAAGH